MRGWGVTRVNDPASVKLNYSERMKFDVTRSRRLRVTLAILLIVIPVCLITCGPADAIDLAANHDSLPNATHCPAHPDSNDSQDSQLPDRAPLCEQTHIGVVLASSSRYISDSHHAQLAVPQLMLVALEVFIFPHSSTLLTHMLHWSIPPLADTLRL